ncbi:MAG: hypothetical protein D6784_09345 [Chloroflexi bacterium]|nr:MAG: hypothetical protein D6784_09345 [Chloroflexota bacterium]
MSDVEKAQVKPEDIHLPANSYWPLVLAIGFGLIVAGLALNIVMVIIGVVITLTAAVGWVIEPPIPEE